MGIEPTLQAYVLKVGVLIKLHGRWQDYYLNLRLYGGGGGIRTGDLLITNQLLWPAELSGHKVG